MKNSVYQYARQALGFLVLVLALSPLPETPISLALAAPGEAQLEFDRQHPLIRAAIEVQEWHTEHLMAIPGVVGTGVGIGSDGMPVIKIYTRRARVPDLPGNLAGIPVKAEIIGMVVALTSHEYNPSSRFARPVPIGISTGHPDITAGTIGARVKDQAGNLYALSNNHIYADSNQAKIWDRVLQPASFDGGSLPEDEIGRLADFIKIDFNGGNNIVDAAIALTDSSLLDTSTMPGGYGPPNMATRTAYIDQAVQKCGRTTGCTSGYISEISVTLNVCYEGTLLVCSKYARFFDQIGISPGSFSSGGDSGSLIVSNDAARNPIALLFAGSSTLTFGNPIDAVLSSFNVTIDGSSEATGPGTEEPAVLTLIATGYKIKGQQRADLEWSGATTEQVKIQRDGATIATTSNSGHYTDYLNKRGSGAYSYRVCESDFSSCSSEVIVAF